LLRESLSPKSQLISALLLVIKSINYLMNLGRLHSLIPNFFNSKIIKNIVFYEFNFVEDQMELKLKPKIYYLISCQIHQFPAIFEIYIIRSSLFLLVDGFVWSWESLNQLRG